MIKCSIVNCENSVSILPYGWKRDKDGYWICPPCQNKKVKFILRTKEELERSRCKAYKYLIP